MHKITEKFTVSVSLLFIFVFAACISNPTPAEKPIINSEEVVTTISQTYTPAVVATVVTAIEDVQEVLLSNKDIELIALVTMAEAEGECEEGKRLVIDTILNRVDSEYFPNTVHDVIYQPNQFSPMWNGRVERCEVREDICLLVREELESRTNHAVMFFTAGQYSKYGIPMFQVESHYFSSYD